MRVALRMIRKQKGSKIMSPLEDENKVKLAFGTISIYIK